MTRQNNNKNNHKNNINKSQNDITYPRGASLLLASLAHVVEVKMLVRWWEWLRKSSVRGWHEAPRRVSLHRVSVQPGRAPPAQGQLHGIRDHNVCNCASMSSSRRVVSHVTGHPVVCGAQADPRLFSQVASWESAPSWLAAIAHHETTPWSPPERKKACFCIILYYFMCVYMILYRYACCLHVFICCYISFYMFLYMCL